VDLAGSENISRSGAKDVSLRARRVGLWQDGFELRLWRREVFGQMADRCELLFSEPGTRSWRDQQESAYSGTRHHSSSGALGSHTLQVEHVAMVVS